VARINEQINTVMLRLTTGMRSEKCVVRRFRRCINVIECTYTNLDSTVYSLLLLGYKTVKRVTVLNTVGNCNKLVSIIIQYYSLMGPQSPERKRPDPGVDGRIILRRIFRKWDVGVWTGLS
jgi:hypothetical protein